jgi:hypothetical protein
MVRTAWQGRMPRKQVIKSENLNFVLKKYNVQGTLSVLVSSVIQLPNTALCFMFYYKNQTDQGDETEDLEREGLEREGLECERLEREGVKT